MRDAIGRELQALENLMAESRETLDMLMDEAARMDVIMFDPSPDIVLDLTPDIVLDLSPEPPAIQRPACWHPQVQLVYAPARCQTAQMSRSNV